jgi:acetyl-CoA carboxylase biotin carboxylase subunit
MRVIHDQAEFDAGLQMAESEAMAAFGDGAVFIEKYVARPRHMEFQVLGDNFGNVVHLFERECSIQRRHQKLVEEAPSCILTHELRARMGKAATDVARACNYSGAGTVEFLMDEGMNFYFLEMNTRLQVEHPVTEQITGIDLVKAQIRVAQGEPLWFTQEDLEINGHSIELRVCAEDPANNFLPDTGVLEEYKIPQGYGVRVDDGFEKGMEIPVFYDSMIAKLVVHADNRHTAIQRMKRAIADFQIQGIQTTLGFGTFVMEEPHFNSGDFDTRFIAQYFTPGEEHLKPEDESLEVAALITAMAFAEKKQKPEAIQKSAEDSAWQKNRKVFR